MVWRVECKGAIIIQGIKPITAMWKKVLYRLSVVGNSYVKVLMIHVVKSTEIESRLKQYDFRKEMNCAGQLFVGWLTKWSWI